MVDRLPTPWGLVRAGVAPDHQRTKGVTRTFEWTASAPGFRLSPQRGDRASRLPRRAARAPPRGDLRGRRARSTGSSASPARTCPAATPRPSSSPGTTAIPTSRDRRLRSVRRACGDRRQRQRRARRRADPAPMPVDELRRTDIADHALEALAESRIEEVVVLGRRGPAQAAFTTPELIALTHANGVDVVVDPAEAQPDAHSAAWLANGAPFGARLKSRVIGEIAASSARRQRAGASCCDSSARPSRSAATSASRRSRWSATRSSSPIGGLSARPTHETELLEAGLVLRSVGYRGRPIEGVAFDSKRAVIPNTEGRVIDDSGGAVPGLYTTGWIKRGPSGVIGTNKQCSGETVRALLEDHAAGRSARTAGRWRRAAGPDRRAPTRSGRSARLGRHRRPRARSRGTRRQAAREDHGDRGDGRDCRPTRRSTPTAGSAFRRAAWRSRSTKPPTGCSASSPTGQPVHLADFCRKGKTGPRGRRAPAAHHQPDAARRATATSATSYEEAIGDIAQRLNAIIDRHGPDAVGSYHGNPMGFTFGTTSFLNGLLDAIGTGNRFWVGSVDKNNVHVVAEELYGNELISLPLDIDNCDCFLLVGMDPAVSKFNWIDNNPNGWNRVLARQRAGRRRDRRRPAALRDRRRGDDARRDPARTGLGVAARRDQGHLRRGPRAPLRRRCRSTAASRTCARLAADADLDDLARRCGVDAEVIRDVARRFATARTAMCVTHTGVAHNEHGTRRRVAGPRAQPHHRPRSTRPGGRRFERGSSTWARS